MFEFVRQSTFASTLPTILSITRAAAQPNVGPLFDFYHFWSGNNRLEDMDGLRPGEIKHVHFQDVPDMPREMLDTTTRFIPGDGVSPLDAMLRKLAEKGYDGALSVELFLPRFRRAIRSRWRARSGQVRARDAPRESSLTLDDLLARDRAHLIHPQHDRATCDAAHVWVRGEGAVLTDADGNEYLDGLSGLWNVVLGHGRRELAEAAARQMNELAYCTGYAGSSNSRAIELAERLAAMMYPSIMRFFFTSGGAEATEASIKTGRPTGRCKGSRKRPR